MAARIKKDDVVFVRSGDDKGKTGKVIDIDLKNGKVKVEGVAVQWKHVKPTQQNPKGSRIQREAWIVASKVQPIDPKTNKGTRVKVQVINGEKHRVAAKTGSDLGVITKAGK